MYSYNQLGKTIAVLGNGFNYIFPEKNKDLYKKILNNGGLIISEYPPNTKCQSKYFLERNRIVSGLSLGILVIEAVFRSGTSVTAKLAFSQNRKIFALPHEIWNSHGIGTNKLIKNGAILVTNTEDILQEFKCLKKMAQKYKTIEKIDLNSLHVDYEIFENSKKSIKSTNSIKSTKSITSIKDTLISSNIIEKKELKNPRLAYLYDFISANPISINELCKKTSTSISKVSSDLFALELEGYIKKVAGGYICISNK